MVQHPASAPPGLRGSPGRALCLKGSPHLEKIFAAGFDCLLAFSCTFIVLYHLPRSLWSRHLRVVPSPPSNSGHVSSGGKVARTGLWLHDVAAHLDAPLVLERLGPGAARHPRGLLPRPPGALDYVAARSSRLNFCCVRRGPAWPVSQGVGIPRRISASTGRIHPLFQLRSPRFSTAARPVRHRAAVRTPRCDDRGVALDTSSGPPRPCERGEPCPLVAPTGVSPCPPAGLDDARQGRGPC